MQEDWGCADFPLDPGWDDGGGKGSHILGSYTVTPQCYSVTPPAWLPSAPLQHLVLCKTMRRAMRNLVVPTFWAVTPLLHHQPVTLHCYTSSLTTTTCAPRTTTTISAASDLFAKCSPGSIWQRSLILWRCSSSSSDLKLTNLMSLPPSWRRLNSCQSQSVQSQSQSHSQTLSHSQYIQSQSQYHSLTVPQSNSITQSVHTVSVTVSQSQFQSQFRQY